MFPEQFILQRSERLHRSLRSVSESVFQESQSCKGSCEGLENNFLTALLWLVQTAVRATPHLPTPALPYTPRTCVTSAAPECLSRVGWLTPFVPLLLSELVLVSYALGSQKPCGRTQEAKTKTLGGAAGISSRLVATVPAGVRGGPRRH